MSVDDESSNAPRLDDGRDPDPEPADERSYEIEDVAFIGRTLAEYVRLFDLDVDDLVGERVLDCPSGACAFVAEANRRGVSTVGVDVMYGTDADTLDKRGRDDIDMAMAGFDGAEEKFEWDFYGDTDGLRGYWTDAHETFIDDFRTERDRYVYAELPDLPFEDDEFSVVLSAHLLFLYGDRLTHEFHVEALRELARVSSKEVRVYPLAAFEGEPYARLDEILETLRSDGYTVEIRSVPFEFQRDATEMLVVSDCAQS